MNSGLKQAKVGLEMTRRQAAGESLRKENNFQLNTVMSLSSEPLQLCNGLFQWFFAVSLWDELSG